MGIPQSFGVMYSELLAAYDIGEGELGWVASVYTGFFLGTSKWFHYNVNKRIRLAAIPCPEVIKLFSCSTQLSAKFILLINGKMPCQYLLLLVGFIHQLRE